MKNTQAAFDWIINILEKQKIKYRISGGLAARAYGANRELADIDIEVADRDVFKLSEFVGSCITFGPARYLDEHWDLNLMTLNYLGQEIDIASNEARIFNQTTGYWEDCLSDINDFEVKRLFDRWVLVETRKSLIAYKTKLAREVDLEDIRQMNVAVDNMG